jgi:hypothetical protein
VPLCIALAPFPASADEREDQAACMNDAMTVCSQFIPDRERVASCLIANPTRISQACRMALTHFDQSRSPPAAAVAAERPAGARRLSRRQFSASVAHQVDKGQSAASAASQVDQGQSGSVAGQIGYDPLTAVERIPQ